MFATCLAGAAAAAGTDSAFAAAMVRRHIARFALAAVLALGLVGGAAPVEAQGKRGIATRPLPARGKDIRLRTPRGSARAAGTHAFARNGYPALKAAAKKLLTEFPPDRYYFVGVGRTPSALVGFLRTLSPDVATSVPASGLKQYPRADHLEAYFEHFDHFIPESVLQGDRAIVFLDGSYGGRSARTLEAVFNAYQGRRGSNLATRVAVWDGQHGDRMVSGVRVYGGTYPFGETDSIAMFNRAHNIGAHDLASLKSARNPTHATFRRALQSEMSADTELHGWLRAQFGELVAEPKPAAQP